MGSLNEKNGDRKNIQVMQTRLFRLWRLPTNLSGLFLFLAITLVRHILTTVS